MGTPPQSSETDGPGGSVAGWRSVRWAQPLVVLMGLYLWVSFHYDIQPLTLPGGPLEGMALLKELPTFLLASVTAVLLLEWSRVIDSAAPVVRHYPGSRSVPGYFVVACLAAAFIVVTDVLFSQPTGAGATAFAYVGWLLLVFAVVVAALALAVSIRGQLELARVLWRPAAVGLLVGGLAWAASHLTSDLWYELADVTLYCVYALLAMLGQPVATVPDTTIIGLTNFAVHIDAACSGYEGVGLIVVFLAGYVWRFRSEFRMARAAILPIVGGVLVWLLNNVRIAALILVGEYFSEAVAVGGFHSKAGWVFFCAVAIGMAWVAHKTPWLLREPARTDDQAVERPAAPYLVPLIVLLAAGLVTGMLVVGFDHLYPVRIGATAVAAWFSWKVLKPDTLRPHALAVAVGLAVLLLWLAVVPPDAELDAIRRATLSELHPAWLYTWLVVRVLGSCVVVPVAEELAFRGFLLRRVMDSEFDRVEYRACSIWALIVSSVAFGALHSESWIAGSLAGLGYGFLVMRTGRLYDAVFAHGLTNAAIAAYVLATGHYYLW